LSDYVSASHLLLNKKQAFFSDILFPFFNPEMELLIITAHWHVNVSI